MNVSLLTALLVAQAASSLSSLDPDNQFALITIVVGCTTGVICMIVMFVSSTINSVHRRRVEADLKREMLDRGMTADEIATVIEAASPPEDGTQRWIASWARPKRA